MEKRSSLLGDINTGEKQTKKAVKQKLNKGITLIALVITIIVLLILAAVSISTLTGESGILTKANEAVIQTNLGTVREAYDLYRTENYEKNKEDFTELLKKVPVGENGEYVWAIQDLKELKVDNLGEYGTGTIPESVSDVLDFDNLYIVDQNDNVSYVVDGKIYGGIELAKDIEKPKEPIGLLKDMVKRGDYVAYEDIILSGSKWRCIFNDEDGVEIVSDSIISRVELNGEDGSWIDTLNGFSKEYCNLDYISAWRSIGSKEKDMSYIENEAEMDNFNLINCGYF